jgi:hypothetical protein
MPRPAFADEVFSETTTANGPEGGAGQGYESGQSHLAGRITGVRDNYHLLIRDNRDQVDHVTLRPGTLVFPRHIALQAGMVVSIFGSRGRNYFLADEIDTPYDLVGGVPYYHDQPWGNYGNDMSLAEYYGASEWWQRNQGNVMSHGSHRGAHAGDGYSHATGSGGTNSSEPMAPNSGAGPTMSGGPASGSNGSGTQNSGNSPASNAGGADQPGSASAGAPRALENPSTNNGPSTSH